MAARKRLALMGKPLSMGLIVTSAGGG